MATRFHRSAQTEAMNRRTFLRALGIATGGVIVASRLPQARNAMRRLTGGAGRSGKRFVRVDC